ncbi:MAG: class I SAM-dependent methyltransferase [Phycisphaerales bacterium]
MTTPRLYSDLAYLWPMLSPVEHYEAEGEAVRTDRAHLEDVRGNKTIPPGTGRGRRTHAGTLADEYECTAVDLSESMLANCRTLIPQVELVVGDMRSVRLDKTFDVVFIHDAIDYMLSEDDLRRTLETVALHLKPGGLCVIAPTYTRETFVDGDVADDGTSTDSEELTYFTYIHDPDPSDDTFEMILLYLIRDMQTRKVELVEDRHTCGLFSEEQWVAWMIDAGFEARQLDADTEGEPWTLFVGGKR